VTAVLGAIFGPLGNVLNNGTFAAATTFTFNGASHEVYVPFTAPKSGTIDTLEFNVTLQSGGGRTLRFMISTVSNTTGLPTGTPAGGSASKDVAYASTGRKVVTLDTPAVVTAGDQLALFVIDGGGAAGSLTLSMGWATASGGDSERVGSLVGTYNGTTRNTSNASILRWQVRYDDGYGIQQFMQDNPAILSFNSGSSPNEYGCAFTVPFRMTAVAVGILVRPTSGAIGEIRFYDGTTLVESVEIRSTANHTWARCVHWLRLATPYQLQTGTTYRVSYVATNATSNDLMVSTFDIAGQRDALLFPDGARWQQTTRTGGGGWTETATKWPVAGLAVSTFDLVAAPTISGVSVNYFAWTRTGPLNTPWGLSWLASASATAYQVRTGAGRTGTLVDSGAAAAGPNSVTIAYAAAGLVDGSQTLYLSVDDGLGNISADATFTLKRDDVVPSAPGGTVGVP
jgi:hypothetical protein